MSSLGWIGVWLLVGAIVLILAEGVVAAVWGLALARRSRALAEGLKREQGLIEADIQRLLVAIEETKRLWQPYGQVLRWLRHPLTIALLGSIARRRAAGR